MKKNSNNFITDSKRQVVNEIHKPARINFKRRKVIIKALKDLIQMDLVEMIPYFKENGGYKYILVAINCFSKFVWASPLKDKSAIQVVRATEKILKEETPLNIQTDMGKEFYNNEFKKLMKKYSINHYSAYSEKKASIVERVNRILCGNSLVCKVHTSGFTFYLALLTSIITRYTEQSE